MKIIEIIQVVTTRSSFLRMGIVPSIDEASLVAAFSATDIVVSSVGFDPKISPDVMVTKIFRLKRGAEEIVLHARWTTELQVCITSDQIIEYFLLFRWIDQIVRYSRRLFSLNFHLDKFLYKYLICDWIINLYNNYLLSGRNFLSCFLGTNPLLLKITKDLQHKNACLTWGTRSSSLAWVKLEWVTT